MFLFQSEASFPMKQRSRTPLGFSRPSLQALNNVPSSTVNAMCKFAAYVWGGGEFHSQ